MDTPIIQAAPIPLHQVGLVVGRWAEAEVTAICATCGWEGTQQANDVPGRRQAGRERRRHVMVEAERLLAAAHRERIKRPEKPRTGKYLPACSCGWRGVPSDTLMDTQYQNHYSDAVYLVERSVR